MRIFTTVVGAALLVGLTSAASAQTSVEIPEAYRIGRSPVPLARAPVPMQRSSGASVEHQAAIDGSFWAEIFPIYNEGSAGNSSYIRLGSGTSASTFTIMFVGSPSGTIYGQGTIQVAANASPQYALSDLRDVAGAGPLTGGDTGYSIYLSNPAMASFYQHVVYNAFNQHFADVTVCPAGASLQGGRNVTNVHTSVLGAFPVTIYLHNFLDIAATYTVRVRDSRTGTLLGELPSLSASANATYAIPESFFETQLAISPTPTQGHLNLEFRATTAFAQVLGIDPDPADVGAIFASVVRNTQSNAVINISNKCLTNR